MTSRRLNLFTRYLAMLIVACCTLLGTGHTASGDAFIRHGERIDDIRILTFRAGEMLYLDARQQQLRVPVDGLQAVFFSDLARLDEAEAALARGDTAEGLRRLQRTLVMSDDATQRLWLHARLAAVHRDRGEFIESAGHIATVLAQDDHPAWLARGPRGTVNQPTFSAASEAQHALAQATSSAQNAQVQRALFEWRQAVEPVAERLRTIDPDQMWEPGKTISGIPVEQLRAEMEQGAQPGGADRDGGAGAGAPADDPQSRQPATPVADGRLSPEALDALLDAGRFEEALRECRRLADNPGQRGLPRFLWQYGRALEGSGERDEATVQYMRCAILFPATVFAVDALMATAQIYLDHHDAPAAARRLLERAARDAEIINDDTRSRRAARLLDLIPEP